MKPPVSSAARPKPIADAMRDAAIAARNENECATKSDLVALRSVLAAFEGRIDRALWIQGAGIIVILAALRLLPL